jgi:hypothetical protein
LYIGLKLSYLVLIRVTKQVKPPSMALNLAPGSGRSGIAEPRKPDALLVRLEGAEAFDHLTSHSKAHLEGSLKDFSIQVISEAKAIEQREHAGKGPPEVTAAHIDEAWWVMRRRIRRARRPGLAVFLRLVETLGSAGMGVGGTNYAKTWGAVTFMICVLIVSGAFVAEAFAFRSE